MKMYIARDMDGSLWIYFGHKPWKCTTYWTNCGVYCEVEDKFLSVHWTDDEPTEVVYDENGYLKIQDLNK